MCLKIYKNIINDDYLLIIKQYNHNKNNKKYNFLNYIKNFENYLKYLNFIFIIKRKFKHYEILIHNYCIRKYIDIYNKWNKLIYKKLNKFM